MPALSLTHVYSYVCIPGRTAPPPPHSPSALDIHAGSSLGNPLLRCGGGYSYPAGFFLLASVSVGWRACAGRGVSAVLHAQAHRGMWRCTRCCCCCCPQYFCAGEWRRAAAVGTGPCPLRIRRPARPPSATGAPARPRPRRPAAHAGTGGCYFYVGTQGIRLNFVVYFGASPLTLLLSPFHASAGSPYVSPVLCHVCHVYKGMCASGLQARVFSCAHRGAMGTGGYPIPHRYPGVGVWERPNPPEGTVRCHGGVTVRGERYF